MVSQSAALLNIINDAKDRAKSLTRKNDALFGFVAALQGCEEGNDKHKAIRTMLEKKISHYSEQEIKNAEVSSIIFGELCLRYEQSAVQKYFMLKYRSLGSSQLAKNATVAAGVKATEAAEAAEESRLEEIKDAADAGGSSDTAKEKRVPNMSSLLVTAVEETDKAAQTAQYTAAVKRVRVSPRLEAKVSVMWLHLCFLY